MFLAALATLAMMMGFLVSPATANAATIDEPAIGSTAYTEQVREVTKNLFTKVLAEDSHGVTFVDEDAHQKYASEIPSYQLTDLAAYINESRGLPTYKNWGAYAVCVLEGATGYGDVKDLITNASQIGQWIAAKNWGKLSELLAKKLLPRLAKLTGTKLNVAAVIGSIAWSAVTCWGK
jgi:hypothetical protein